MIQGGDDLLLRKFCAALSDHHVEYVIFGSFAGQLQGAPLQTVDVDVVPEMSEANLQRLCDAPNSLDRVGELMTCPRECVSTAAASNLATSEAPRWRSDW